MWPNCEQLQKIATKQLVNRQVMTFSAEISDVTYTQAEHSPIFLGW